MENVLDHGIFEHPNVDTSQFQLYKSFHNVEEAKDFAQLLYDHKIVYTAESSETIIDEAIVGTGLLPKVIIKIAAEDFKKVNTIIEEQLANADYSDVQDHYLNQLDTSELQEIFQKPDEWTIEDVNIAKLILRNRGVSITDQEIRRLREARLNRIRQGKKGNTTMMAFYFLAIALGIFIPFGLVFIIGGIGMGYYYANGKSVDPDGVKYFTFDAETRKFGNVILYGGLLAFIIALVVLFWLGQ